MPRTSSFRNITDLEPGDHLCYLYETVGEHQTVITPFLCSGLEQNQKILYITDTHTTGVILDYLRADGFNADPYLAKGQLTFLPVETTYMRDYYFGPNKIITLIQAETERALADGYTALRVTGEMTWVSRGRLGFYWLIEYEAKLNAFFLDSKCLLLCQYYRHNFNPEILLEVLATHPTVVVDNKVYDNIYFREKPDAGATLKSWLANLKTRKQPDEELITCKQELLTLHRISEIFLTIQSLEAAYQEATNEISSVTDFPLVMIELYDAARQMMILKGAQGITLPSNETIFEFPMNETLSGTVIHTNQPLVEFVTDRVGYANKTLRQLGIQVFISVPMIVNQKVIGALSLGHPERIQPDDRFIPWLENLGNHIASHIERRLVEEELTWEVGVNWAVSELAYTLIQSVSLSDISALVLEYAKRITNSKFGYVGHIDSQTGYLVCPNLIEDMMQNDQVSSKEFALKPSNDLGEWVLNHRQALLTNTPNPHSTDDLLKNILIERFLSVPALLDDNLLGQITLANSDRDYTENDLEHIERLAALYALAIQRKNDEAALRQAKEELELRVAQRTAELQREIIERKREAEEKERIQAELFLAQKMEAVGTLAGGIAHDFNNLLTVITGYTELTMETMEETDPIHEDLKLVRHAGMRAAELTRQLLMFSRRQPMELTSLNLNQPIEELLKMLTRIIGEDITIITDLAPDLRSIQGDRTNIEQVLMNLVLNSRDAMPEGGILTIKTENVTLDEELAKDIPNARLGHFVCLSVMDTGVGMDKTTLDRIFEPFFTTKEAGKGTGLGLSVIYGIVKQHEGWVMVSSEPGHGSTFKIFLPALLVNPEDTIKEKMLPEKLQGTSERILLVEDDEKVRKFATNVLERNGYVVFMAANAKEALEIFESENGNFDLVFSDVVLPDKSGVQLVDRLRSYNPNLRILLCSGYTDQKVQWLTIHERGFRFLQKPYNVADLLRTVSELIT